MSFQYIFSFLFKQALLGFFLGTKKFYPMTVSWGGRISDRGRALTKALRSKGLGCLKNKKECGLPLAETKEHVLGMLGNSKKKETKYDRNDTFSSRNSHTWNRPRNVPWSKRLRGELKFRLAKGFKEKLSGASTA